LGNDKIKLFCDNCHRKFEEGDEVISFDDSTYCDCDCMCEAICANYATVTYPGEDPVLHIDAGSQPHKERVK
jgi:squalene cyclase